VPTLAAAAGGGGGGYGGGCGGGGGGGDSGWLGPRRRRLAERPPRFAPRGGCRCWRRRRRRLWRRKRRRRCGDRVEARRVLPSEDCRRLGWRRRAERYCDDAAGRGRLCVYVRVCACVREGAGSMWPACARARARTPVRARAPRPSRPAIRVEPAVLDAATVTGSPSFCAAAAGVPIAGLRPARRYCHPAPSPGRPGADPLGPRARVAGPGSWTAR
jgi:hypothetical protein